MKVYQCDGCDKVIEDPYTVSMKEFCVGVTFEDSSYCPCNTKRKVKIHLCDDCFNGLYKIAEKASDTKSTFNRIK